MKNHNLNCRIWTIILSYVAVLGISYPALSEEGRNDSKITLEYLLDTNKIIQRRAEQGPAKFDPKSGSTSGKGIDPKEEDGGADVPKGARDYSAPKEDDVKLVEVESKALSREQRKAKGDKTDAPDEPPKRLQISFSSGVIEVSPGIDRNLLNALENDRDSSRTFAFLIASQYLGERQFEQLSELGVKVLGLHDEAYKIELPFEGEVLERLIELPFVDWVGYPEPKLKISTELQNTEKEFGKEVEHLPVYVNLIHEFDEKTAETFRRRLSKLDIKLGLYDSDLGAFEAIVTQDQLKLLSQQDIVLFIELISPGGPAHDFSAPTIGADYIRTGGPGTNFSGSSTVVGVLDTGFMLGSGAATPHTDLNRNGCGINYTNDSAGVFDDENGHGTHVLGTIGGTGTTNRQLRGVATGIGSSGSTRIRVAKIWPNVGSANASWYLDGMNFMARSSGNACDSGKPKVINMSGGRSVSNPNGTDARSRKLDAKSFRDKQAYIIATGNEGSGATTLRTPATAKNAISVGNVIDTGFQTVGDIRASSSRGPTADGRMKPNVVAVGRSVNSVNAGTSNGYTLKTGTSMAAPHVTGLAATLLDHYSFLRDRPYLLRAHLMATSILHDNNVTPRNNTNGGRNTYGLGRVSSYISHWARSNSDGWSTHLAWRTISNSNWGFRDITVPSGADRLVVVMTWDEDRASSGASKAVKYDLDLWVDRGANCTPDPRGQCGEWASQSWDDNVEYLIIDNPPSGTYRLKIINWDAPSSGLPTGLVATVIRGDPTPEMSLTASASSSSVSVGSPFTINTTVSNSEYVASGVLLQLTNSPSGILSQGISTRREDGRTSSFTGSSVTLGNIVESDSRQATWSFTPTRAGTKTFDFRAWSENGGTETRSVSVVVSP